MDPQPPRTTGGREVCLKYNSRQCNFKNCKQAHFCQECFEEHLLPGAPIMHVESALNYEAFKQYFNFYLDIEWWEKLLQGIRKLAYIWHEGPCTTVDLDKWKSATDCPDVFEAYLYKEGLMHWKACPFCQLLFSVIVRSPMGVILKKYLSLLKFCFICDLSCLPGISIKNHIDRDLFHCFYASFDETTWLVKRMAGLLRWLNWPDDFKHILVWPADRSQ